MENKFLITYSHEWLGEKWVSVAHVYPADVVGNDYQCYAGEYFQNDKEIIGDVDIVHDHTV